MIINCNIIDILKQITREFILDVIIRTKKEIQMSLIYRQTMLNLIHDVFHEKS